MQSLRTREVFDIGLVEAVALGRSCWSTRASRAAHSGSLILRRCHPSKRFAQCEHVIDKLMQRGEQIEPAPQLGPPL